MSSRGLAIAALLAVGAALLAAGVPALSSSGGHRPAAHTARYLNTQSYTVGSLDESVAPVYDWVLR